MTINECAKFVYLKTILKVFLRWWTSPHRPCPALPCRPPASVCSVAPEALWTGTSWEVEILVHLSEHAGARRHLKSTKTLSKHIVILSNCQRYMAEILPIWRITLYNQSFKLLILIMLKSYCFVKSWIFLTIFV